MNGNGDENGEEGGNEEREVGNPGSDINRKGGGWGGLRERGGDANGKPAATATRSNDSAKTSQHADDQRPGTGSEGRDREGGGRTK